MPRDAVLTETLASFAIAGECEDENPAVIPSQKPRRLTAIKGDNGKVGRSRFAGDVCTEHPEWEHDDGTRTVAIPGDFPCAKFSGLPGKGRGIVQPSIRQILVATTLEFARPLVLIGMLVAGLYGFSHVVLHGGGFHPNFLRPTSSVQKSTGGMSNSSEQPTGSAVPSHPGKPARRTAIHPSSIPAHKAVKP